MRVDPSQMCDKIQKANCVVAGGCLAVWLARLDPQTTVWSSFEPCALSSGRPLRSMPDITAGAWDRLFFDISKLLTVCRVPSCSQQKK